MASVAPSDVPQRLGQYTLVSPLSPTSGHEWRARDQEDGSTVCVKVERSGTRGGIIEREQEVYALLSGEDSFPSLIDADTASGFDFLVTDLPGPRMDAVRDNMDKPMDIGLVCSFAIQLLLLLETLHSKNLVHGNVSLQSTFLGLGPDKHRIFLTGFSVTRLVFERVPVSKVIECNPTFSSQRVHCLRQMPTPIDDLESLALILIHLIHPRGLPWSHLSSSPHDSTLLSSKYRTSPDRLCSTIPAEFQSFLEYCRSFNPTPNDDASIDYNHWVGEFRSLKVRRRYPDHDMFVYEPPAPLSLPQIVTSNTAPVHRRAVETAYTSRTSRANLLPQHQSHTASGLRPNFASPPPTHRTSVRPSVPSSYNEDFASIPPSTAVHNNTNNTNNGMVSISQAQLTYLIEAIMSRDAVPPSYAVSTSNTHRPSPTRPPRSSPGLPTEPTHAEPAFRTMRHAASSRSAANARPIRLPPREEKSSRQSNSDRDTDTDNDSDTESSSDNENASPFPELANTYTLSPSLKQSLLIRVHVQISSTTSKSTLAAAFSAYTTILRRSAYMSKPAFGVLAALQKKLYKREITLDYSGAKLVVVRELSYDIRAARTHKDVAKMIARFYAIMEANDHKVTKDGYTFLEGVTAKLKSL